MADSPMVLVPRDGWERARRFLSGCVEAGEIGPEDGENPADVFEALSASPVGEGSKPTGEQIVCGNDWQRRMFAPSPPVGEELREDVRRWMEEQHEWFQSNVVEIVTEYANWRDRQTDALPRGEGEQDREGIFSPFNACCYRETCRAMARAAPTPGEGDARHCPCGKPSLQTASICSDCADACLASGEGDAPVAWRYRYLDSAGGWSFSESRVAMENAMEREPSAFFYEPLFTRPTPATPEGLREEVDSLIDDEWEAMVGSGPDAFANPASISHDEFAAAIRGVLAALQPQGGD